MKYDSIIFDLYGTLWDAAKASVTGWNNALRSLGSSRIIKHTEMESVTGKQIEECIYCFKTNSTNEQSHLARTT